MTVSDLLEQSCSKCDNVNKVVTNCEKLVAFLLTTWVKQCEHDLLADLLQAQALKYRSVTDIVRPIRKIVRRGEKGIGHYVRPKEFIICSTRLYLCACGLHCLFAKIVKKKVRNQRCTTITMFKSNLLQTETKATGHHFKYVRPKSKDAGHFVRCVTDRYFKACTSCEIFACVTDAYANIRM